MVFQTVGSNRLPLEKKQLPNTAQIQGQSGEIDMAYFDPSFDHTSGLRQSLSAILSRVFETPFDTRQRRLAAQVSELRALSDIELAANGLRREDILFHVFGRAR